MQYLIYLLVIYLILWGLRYVLTFLQLLKMRFQYACYQIPAKASVPDSVQHLFKSPIATYRASGFKPCCYLQTQSITQLEPPVAWELLLYHPDHKTYAILSLRFQAEPGDWLDVDFYTFFTDRTLLVTLNGKAHGVLGEVPQTILQDAYAADWQTQWQLHQERIAQIQGQGEANPSDPKQVNRQVCALPPDRFISALQALLRRYIDQLRQSGQLLPAESATFRLAWRSAIGRTRHLIQQGPKVAKLAKARRQQAGSAADLPDLPVELEVQSFQRMEYLQRDLVGRKFRTWLLIGSLALFLVSYTQMFSATTFGLFMAALLLHEGGHLLAMKVFGYRNTALLFLPFLGALATAHKEDASLSEKFWISLAGPLPGLILGIGLSGFLTTGTYPAWLTEASWILIGLNLFNLLPIYPLDGGQIADLLVFSRHPYVGVVFKLMGVVLLGWIGLQQPMLLIFAGLIALGIPQSFRVAKLTVRMRRQLKAAASKPLPPDRQTDRSTQTNAQPDRQQLLHQIFTQLRQTDHAKLPFSQRYGLVKTLLMSHRELQASWLTRMGLGLIYTVSLLGGMVGTLQALIPEWPTLFNASWAAVFQDPNTRIAQMKADRQQRIEQMTQQLAVNPQDIAAYQQRAEDRAWLEDYAGALADYDQMVRLQPENTDLLMGRAGYRAMLGDQAGAIQDYSRILQLNPQAAGVHQLRAQAYLQRQDHAKAVADYTTALRLTPEDYWLYLDRGYARLTLKDYHGAIADANAILQQEPDQPDAYMLRAEAKLHLGDPSTAADRSKAEALFEIQESL